jgi:two-component system, sensor histidine kinase PdtaS
MSRYKKSVFLCFTIWLLTSYTGQCQHTHGGLGVPKPAVNMLSVTMADLDHTSSDTAEVRLLLQLSRIYYWQDRIRHHYYWVDSAVFFAQQAMGLSSHISFTEGLTEAEFLLCKIAIEKPDLAAARRIVGMATGEERIRLLMVIGRHYVLLPPPVDGDNSQIAFTVLMEALSLAERLHSDYWLVESQAMLGQYYYAIGQIARGQDFFFRIIKRFEQTHDVAGQAFWWSQMENYMPLVPETYGEQLGYYQRAIDLYLSINKKAEAAGVYGAMAYLVKSMNDLDYAKKLYFKKIALLKEAGENKFYDVFLLLAEIYYTEGNLNNALSYALQALRNIERLHADEDISQAYRLLGDIYRGLNEIGRAGSYYRLCLDYSDGSAFKRNCGYSVLRSYTTVLISEGKSAEALAFAQNYIAVNPPMFIFDHEFSEDVLGACYDAVGNTGMAEKRYLEMIRWDTFCQVNLGKTMYVPSNMVGAEAYHEIGKFYVSHNRYREAQPYLDKALTFKKIPAPIEKDVSFLQFRTDSASGNLLGAIRHYQRSVFLKDSLLASERLQELNYLNVQFETAEKERNIKLLEKEAQLQKRKLDQSAQLRMWSGAAMLLLVAVLVILYNRNRLKNKKNIQLERQKEIINDKNVSLSQLVREKEWLLKEVHHRVKNNLQIVTSLLNSQLDLISEGPVLYALLEGKRRIQAMAMIHQRLYNTDEYNSVLMPSYISELVDYLKESFNPGNRVIFKLSIEPVVLNLSVAVPFALILNEAISNSLKHGFPDRREGTIIVELRSLGGQTKVLKVADDGVGIPPSVDERNPNSFGLRLIRGFTSDISGTLKIERSGGTSIVIVFDVKDEGRVSVANV